MLLQLLEALEPGLQLSGFRLVLPAADPVACRQAAELQRPLAFGDRGAPRNLASVDRRNGGISRLPLMDGLLGEV